MKEECSSSTEPSARVLLCIHFLTSVLCVSVFLTWELSVLPQASRCPHLCPHCTQAASHSKLLYRPAERNTRVKKHTNTNNNHCIKPKTQNCSRNSLLWTGAAYSKSCGVTCSASYDSQETPHWVAAGNQKQWTHAIVKCYTTLSKLPAEVPCSWSDLWWWSKKSHSHTALHPSPDAVAGCSGPDWTAW